MSSMDSAWADFAASPPYTRFARGVDRISATLWRLTAAIPRRPRKSVGFPRFCLAQRRRLRRRLCHGFCRAFVAAAFMRNHAADPISSDGFGWASGLGFRSRAAAPLVRPPDPVAFASPAALPTPLMTHCRPSRKPSYGGLRLCQTTFGRRTCHTSGQALSAGNSKPGLVRVVTARAQTPV